MHSHPARAPRVPRLHQARRPIRPRLESLEQRLVLSWYGAPPDSVVPSAVVSVALNTQGDASGNAAITANEVDYYSFVAPTGGSYRIEALTPSSNLDTVLGVFSSSGARLASNDDISSRSRDSRVTIDLVANNRYYFGITNYTRTAGGSYLWQVDGPVVQPLVDDSYEDNDAQSLASSLGTPEGPLTVSGLAMADSADWFSFTTTSAGTSASRVSLGFQNAQGDLDLQLVAANGQVLGISETTGNVEAVSLNGLGAGTYYIRVFGWQGVTNPSYSLTVAPPQATTGTPTGGTFDIVIRSSGLTPSQQSAFDSAAARWEQIIVGDLPDATFEGLVVDDILIDAASVPIDGVGGILGQAGPDYVRGGSYLPIHGSMEFDTADLGAMESDGTLTEVILHEMGHVLGIGTIWRALGLLSGAGTANPLFLGARATGEYNALFGTSASGVPVEGTPAPEGTRDGHWRESLFGNELMSGYIASSGNAISRITVASLADIGYTVNMAAADAYAPSSSAVRAVGGTVGSSGTSLVFAEPEAPTGPFARRSPISRWVAPLSRRPWAAFGHRYA